jgi:hypothetical protein
MRNERPLEVLGVDADPASILLVPVLGDPVVLALAGLKVRAEAAARTCGYAPEAQQRAA